MKTPLLYGSLIAIVGALLTFGLFFAGFHDTPEKLSSVQWVPFIVLIAHVLFVALAMRERRANFPLDRDWTYGSALGCGVLTGLVSTVLGAIIGVIYYPIVNPQFGDVLFQLWYTKAEPKMPAERLEAASGFMHKIYSPVGLTIATLINGIVVTVIVALIVAIFFKKRAVQGDSLAPAETPAIPPSV